MKNVDVAVIGSGLSGSLAAHVLADQGCSVGLIDPTPHPRITLGESSTPIADWWMRILSQRFELPWLDDWSRWSTLRRRHPHLVAGLKRGFSYYQHRSGGADRAPGGVNLSETSLIAASRCDAVSDSHLWRADFDADLFQRAMARGVRHRAGERVIAIDDGGVTVEGAGERRRLQPRWIIDASGTAAVTAKLMGAPDRIAEVRTRTRCRYSHRRGVQPIAPEYATAADPFNGDDAAAHHLCDDRGWVWMLRFDDGTTSVGVVERRIGDRFASIDWQNYPTLASSLGHSVPIAGGDWRWAGGGDRAMQRRTDPTTGTRVLRMPAAAATLDPLHSTGLAMAMAAVARVVDVVIGGDSNDHYARRLDRELDWIDRMVASAYRSMGDFRRFELATWVYLTTAIATEERLAAGHHDEAMFGLDDPGFRGAIGNAMDAINDSTAEVGEIRRRVLEAIEPWNVAGLGTRDDGRYAYTATKI